MRQREPKTTSLPLRPVLAAAGLVAFMVGALLVSNHQSNQETTNAKPARLEVLGTTSLPDQPTSMPTSTTEPNDLATAAAQVERSAALTPLTSLTPQSSDAVEPSATSSPESNAATPVGFSFPRLGVETAIVRPVGVKANGEMEIPPESEVGWYRYSPRPGEAGSSVLAGHVNFDGRDGAFRYLTDVELGDNFSVAFSDGSTRDFVVSETAQYDKTELPNERIFARAGEAEVALITCGGIFDYDARSYEDNVVVYGVPIS